MTVCVHVPLGARAYDIHIGQGLLGQAASHIAPFLQRPKVVIVTDSNVASLHLATLTASLDEVGIRHAGLTLPAGESTKSWPFLVETVDFFLNEKVERRDVVIALGGGVIGDLVGFAAAVLRRGVRFIQIPTSLLAQVDSSVGGKTGINAAQGKNLIGAFHQPRLVLTDPDTLLTLPGREFREGFAEVIKHAAIRDFDMLRDLEALDPLNQNIPSDLIARNVAIKARVVEEDEKETSGTRALLNFGHTIGHGIEASVPYGTLLHGEAISLGIRAALKLSEDHAGLSREESDRILALLKHFQLPLELPANISSDLVLEKLGRDKKFSGGKKTFVLLNKLGNGITSDSVPQADILPAIELRRSPLHS